MICIFSEKYANFDFNVLKPNPFILILIYPNEKIVIYKKILYARSLM